MTEKNNKKKNIKNKRKKKININFLTPKDFFKNPFRITRKKKQEIF